jgi:hypothetical protein
MVPIEETLHILLRDHTHRAIREQIKRNSVKDIRDVKKIVDEWIAVEEALAGALVNVLLPSFVKEYSGPLPHGTIQKAMDSRREFERYKYLDRGIQVIRNMDITEAIRLYIQDPEKFKTLLT